MTRYFAPIATSIAAVATILTTVVTFSCNFFEGYRNKHYGFWRAEDSDGYCMMYGYYDDYYYYSDTHLSTDLLDGPMKYARAASMIAFTVSICIFCSLFVTSAMKLCGGTCCQIRKEVFRMQGYIMLVLALLLVTSFAALGSDLCQDAGDCTLGGGAYTTIVTILLWIGAAVMLFYVQDDDIMESDDEGLEGSFVVGGDQKLTNTTRAAKPQMTMEQAPNNNAQLPPVTEMVDIDLNSNNDNDSVSV